MWKRKRWHMACNSQDDIGHELARFLTFDAQVYDAEVGTPLFRRADRRDTQDAGRVGEALDAAERDYRQWREKAAY